MAEKTLNARQRAFVLAYSSGPTLGNATASARAAGYRGDDETLATTGSRMLRNADVASELHRIEAQQARPKIADAAEVRELMTEMLRDARAPKADRVRAGTVLAKMGGWFSFIHRHEGSEGGAIVHEVKVTLADAKVLAKEKP